MNVLQVKKLTKAFDRKIAIENLTFNITPGSITGFLGPNGAGKSTTMNIMMGFIRPSEGSVRIFGKPVIIDTHLRARRLGFCPIALS
jgi:ABC-2 type transport system ATP-binding protein